MSSLGPTLSVVIATAHPGKDLPPAIDAIAGQTLAVGGEVLLVTSARAILPAELDRSRVTLQRVDSADIFALRAAGVAAARGQTIAVTEDHVIVGPQWAESTLRAHAEHPQAAVVGGPVENGSRHKLMDWANFLMTFGPFLPPITAERHHRMPVIANMSLKRAALPEFALAPGDLEFVLLPQFAAEQRIVFHEAPLVWHLQSHGTFEAVRMHFQNGRASLGLRANDQPWPQRRLRGGLCRLRGLVTDAVITVRERPLPRRARASLPLLLLLCASHAAGEWVGGASGAGRSGEQLV